MAGPKELIPLEQFSQLKVRSRGYLPHWEIEGATYFITYRLHDSLPRHVVARLKEERRRLSRKAFGRALDRELDEGRGAAHLRDPRMADAVAENLKHFHGERYELIAWCVMPNHVHAVMTPFVGLKEILHSWKSYTAHQAVEILGVTKFWAREYYDHIIRNDRELADTIVYVRNNPRSARLNDWPWIG